MWQLINLICLPVLLCADTGVTLEGSVVDQDGRPIAGAVVDIATAAPRVGTGIFCPSCYPDCQKKATTGADGKFSIAQLNPSLKFRVLVCSPGKKPVLTKLIDPLLAPLHVTLENSPREMPVERTVRGKIVDELGKPVGGALVECTAARTGKILFGGSMMNVDPTISDASGEFTLLLPADYLAIDVEVRADGFAGNIYHLLEPGAKVHELCIPAGTRVIGQLSFDGKPAAGVRVAVVQTNRAARSFFVQTITATSNASGNFEFKHLPASQEYVIFSVVGDQPQTHVLATTKFKAVANDESHDLGTIELAPALHIRGRVRLPMGEAVPDQARIIIGREPAWDLISATIDKDGQFEVQGLPPETYTMQARITGWQIDLAKFPKAQVTREQRLSWPMKTSWEKMEIPLIRK